MTSFSPSREDILMLARAAGLDLAPAYQDELVSAYDHLRTTVARLPNARALGDESAHVFDLVRFTPTRG